MYSLYRQSFQTFSRFWILTLLATIDKLFLSSKQRTSHALSLRPVMMQALAFANSNSIWTVLIGWQEWWTTCIYVIVHISSSYLYIVWRHRWCNGCDLFMILLSKYMYSRFCKRYTKWFPPYKCVSVNVPVMTICVYIMCI